MPKLLRVVIPLLLGAVFLIVLIYSSLDLGEIACEVCIEYNGEMQCRRARATTEEDAIRAAVDNACALVTSGRDDLIACSQVPPLNVVCE